MHCGSAMFFTDYSMSAIELARALDDMTKQNGQAA
jgi:hypothetical protein